VTGHRTEAALVLLLSRVAGAAIDATPSPKSINRRRERLVHIRDRQWLGFSHSPTFRMICLTGSSALLIGDALDNPKPPPARQAGAALEYAEPRAKQSVRLLQQSALLSQRRTRRQRLSRPRGLWRSATADALYSVRSSRRQRWPVLAASWLIGPAPSMIRFCCPVVASSSAFSRGSSTINR
jgi:hypothetical protein